MKDKPIRLTKAQRDRIFNCGVGVGVAAYKSADHQITEFEFYIDRKDRMRSVGTGALVSFEVERDEEGYETNAKVVEHDAEMQARADILNRAVEHRNRLFPDDIGNGWIDSIDRLAGEVERLRAERQTILDICTLKAVYIGNFYKDAVKIIKAMLSEYEITS